MGFKNFLGVPKIAVGGAIFFGKNLKGVPKNMARTQFLPF